MRRALLALLLVAAATACSDGSAAKLALRPLPEPPAALDRSPAFAADGDAVILLADRTVLRLDAFTGGAVWQRVIDDVPGPAGSLAARRGRLWYITTEGGNPQLVDVALSGDARLGRRRLDGVDASRYDIVAGLSAVWLVSGADTWRIDDSGTVLPLLSAKVARLQALGELPDGTFLALAADEQQIWMWTSNAGWAPTSLDPQIATAGARQTNSGLLFLSRDGYATVSNGPTTERTKIAPRNNCPAVDVFAADIGIVIQECDLAVRAAGKTTRVALPDDELVVFAGPRGRPLLVRDRSELLLLS